MSGWELVSPSRYAVHLETECFTSVLYGGHVHTERYHQLGIEGLPTGTKCVVKPQSFSVSYANNRVSQLCIYGVGKPDAFEWIEIPE